MRNTMIKTMLTSATQQRNSQDNLQDNLQGNPQSETSPISIETSPIAPIIDAATIFSLKFTARIKRISAILIMSALMVFLAACGGGGGGGDPITTPTKFTVIELEATPGNMKVTLSWTNPAAQIANISINYGITNSADRIDPIIITNSTQLITGDSVEQVIPDLTNGQSYTFNVTLALNGTDAGKEGAVQSVTTTLASDAIPPPLTTGISVSNLRVIPDESSAMLMWDNPDADIQHIDIMYTTGAAASLETRSRITDPSKIIRAKKNVTQIIGGLTAANYTFNIHLELKGSDADKPVEVVSITHLIGSNIDGDEYADADPLELDIDGDDVNNTMDAFPSDPTESVDTDGDRVGDNADNCPLVMNNEQNDFDNDVVGDACDVDADGDGLIEIATAQQLNQSRHNLLGSNFTRSAGGVGDANGCGNGTMEGEDVTACNGYELIADIYLTTYANWQPIGRCTTSAFNCEPVDELFNATFDGNSHTINDLTITNHDGSYANAAGLFRGIRSTSILRNIHIRSGNISDGGHNVGLLVGYARGAMIINSSAEGAVTASGNNVGGLVGNGEGSTITSSYAAGGAVSGRNDVGGLVGDGRDSTITSSYAAGGDVSGLDEVGGLVGWGFASNITSSYAAGGDVIGTSESVGGLVGDGRFATITSSYAAGGDVGRSSNVGGLVGRGGAATITSSYAAGGAVNGNIAVGGLVGLGDTNTTTPNSYWDNSLNIMGPSDGRSYGSSQTTSDLHTGTGGIYVEWTTMCADGSDTWDFGTASDYPALNCTPGGLPAQEHLRQR